MKKYIITILFLIILIAITYKTFKKDFYDNQNLPIENNNAISSDINKDGQEDIILIATPPQKEGFPKNIHDSIEMIGKISKEGSGFSVIQPAKLTYAGSSTTYSFAINNRYVQNDGTIAIEVMVVNQDYTVIQRNHRFQIAFCLDKYNGYHFKPNKCPQEMTLYPLPITTPIPINSADDNSY